jgi:transcriptional regulator with XRE-family HTH domain
MDFWMRLKNEIKAQNTTQEWIAGKIGVPLSTFRKWMTRRTYPNVKEGIEIAKLLETSAEYLVTGAEPQDLDDTERKLMTSYRKLSSADRENVILAINAWVGKNEFSDRRRK